MLKLLSSIRTHLAINTPPLCFLLPHQYIISSYQSSHFIYLAADSCFLSDKGLGSIGHEMTAPDKAERETQPSQNDTLAHDKKIMFCGTVMDFKVMSPKQAALLLMPGYNIKRRVSTFLAAVTQSLIVSV